MMSPRKLKYLLVRMASPVAVALLASVPVAQAQVRGNFDDADSNHDGRVTLQEFETYATGRLLAASGRPAERFKQLSAQQQAAVLQRRFAKLDKDGKGYLDRNEWNGS